MYIMQISDYIGVYGLSFISYCHVKLPSNAWIYGHTVADVGRYM
jgi:hypothetical protein